MWTMHWDPSWPSLEPRDNPAWNNTAKARVGKHGLTASQPMITNEAARIVTDVPKKPMVHAHERR
jgi:hypothetical protein